MNLEEETGDPSAGDAFLKRVAATAWPRGFDGTVVKALSAQLGTGIGGYQVRHRIGAGGMGIVFAARDPRLQRDVALKLLRPGRSGTHARLLREARALARLAHPNVVTIHEVGTHADSVFLAMEYVRGRTLRDWAVTGPALPEVAEAFAQAAKGLRAAHRQRIVHRDFKPDNAVIGEDGRVRVLDFGVSSMSADEHLATAVDSRFPANDVLSTAGVARGTVQYMPPEQRAGDRVGPEADVYAFSVSLYEVLHGHRPAFELGSAQLAWRRDAPRALVDAIRRGLDPDPHRRAPDLSELIGVLERIVSPPRRAAVVGVAAAIVAVAIGAAGGAWLAGRPDPPPADGDHPPSAIGPVYEILVCKPEMDDPRSCEELSAALQSPTEVPDQATRCAYRRACAGPITCPSGTHADGTLGCALPPCEAMPERAGEVCLAEGGQCCLLAANVAYEDASNAENEGDPDSEATRERGRGFLRAACDAGDAYGCFGVGKNTTDDLESIAAFVRGCELGNVQACRRIATLPETEEIDTSCMPGDPEHCDRVERPQLAFFAACGGIVKVIPLVEKPEQFLEQLDLSRGLAADEPPLLRRSVRRFHEGVREELSTMLDELGGEAPSPEASVGQWFEHVDDIVMRRSDGLGIDYRRALVRLADERAGIEPLIPLAEAGVLDRWVRLGDTLGDRLEAELAREVGPDRAAALRGTKWAGSRVYVSLPGSCPRTSASQ